MTKAPLTAKQMKHRAWALVALGYGCGVPGMVLLVTVATGGSVSAWRLAAALFLLAAMVVFLTRAFFALRALDRTYP